MSSSREHSEDRGAARDAEDANKQKAMDTLSALYHEKHAPLKERLEAVEERFDSFQNTFDRRFAEIEAVLRSMKDRLYKRDEKRRIHDEELRIENEHVQALSAGVRVIDKRGKACKPGCVWCKPGVANGAADDGRGSGVRRTRKGGIFDGVVTHEQAAHAPQIHKGAKRSCRGVWI